jgi:hypothetical protein
MCPCTFQKFESTLTVHIFRTAAFLMLERPIFRHFVIQRPSVLRAFLEFTPVLTSQTFLQLSSAGQLCVPFKDLGSILQNSHLTGQIYKLKWDNML